MFVCNYIRQRKTTKSWPNCSASGTPLLADSVQKCTKMSRRKHTLKLLHKLHNPLRHVCEISTETAKHGRNRQPQNSLNSTHTAKRQVIHKTGIIYIIYRNVARGRPSHGHRGSAQKIHEDRSSGSRDMLADRQTHRQTDKLITNLRSPIGAE